MKVLIFGDLAITKSNEIKFAEGKIQDVFSKEIISLFHDVDFSLFNLESPLYDSFSEPIKKCGPTLGANKECINGIRELNPSLVCVANNHIYDYGYSGFSTTLSELQNNNIPTIGGILDGNSKEYCVKNEVAILNVAENEFSFNYKDRSGAYCLSSSVFSKIRELKENTKRVVVVFHGGTENIQYPSPDLIEICHAFVDLGADLVLCQHSHRIGCFENYKDAKIVYGQGNFLFDEYSKSVEWTHGLGIIYDSNANDVEFILTSFKNSVVQILNNVQKKFDE